MYTVKIIQTPFHLPIPSPFHLKRSRSGRKSSLCYCNGGDDADGAADTPEGGDKKKQDLLAQIVMLQTQKVRLTSFLDERAKYLTQFAEDANVEFDQIGENALKELEEASDRIMANLDSRAQAFEESAEINRMEIEKNEKVLEEFEEQIQRERNEGMFFKNLGDKKPAAAKTKAEAKLEARKVLETAKRSAGARIRWGVYLALISVLAVTIGDAVLANPDQVEWRKVAALGLILVGLIAQLTYERSLSPSSTTQEEEEEEEESDKREE